MHGQSTSLAFRYPRENALWPFCALGSEISICGWIRSHQAENVARPGDFFGRIGSLLWDATRCLLRETGPAEKYAVRGWRQGIRLVAVPGSASCQQLPR